MIEIDDRLVINYSLSLFMFAVRVILLRVIFAAHQIKVVLRSRLDIVGANYLALSQVNFRNGIDKAEGLLGVLVAACQQRLIRDLDLVCLILLVHPTILGVSLEGREKFLKVLEVGGSHHLQFPLLGLILSVTNCDFLQLAEITISRMPFANFSRLRHLLLLLNVLWRLIQLRKLTLIVQIQFLLRVIILHGHIRPRFSRGGKRLCGSVGRCALNNFRLILLNLNDLLHLIGLLVGDGGKGVHHGNGRHVLSVIEDKVNLSLMERKKVNLFGGAKLPRAPRIET